MNKLLPLFGSIFMMLAMAAQAQTSGVLREVWTNLEGSTIPDLTLAENFPAAPVLRVVDGSFAAPVNWAERYGVRMRAFLTPTVSGNYTFYVSGDDNCELWLGTNDTPASKVRVASFSGYTNPQQWTKYAGQKSAEIALTAGQRYYIEAQMKEGYGGDHLSVGWATSPTAAASVIPGSVLTPFEVPASLPTGVVVEAGRNQTQHAPNFVVDLQAQALNAGWHLQEHHNLLAQATAGPEAVGSVQSLHSDLAARAAHTHHGQVSHAVSARHRVVHAAAAASQR